jgi:hypothetical protein
LEKVEQLEKDLETTKAAIVEGNIRKKDAVQRCQEIEKEMNDFKNNKDGKLQELTVSGGYVDSWSSESLLSNLFTKANCLPLRAIAKPCKSQGGAYQECSPRQVYAA